MSSNFYFLFLGFFFSKKKKKKKQEDSKKVPKALQSKTQTRKIMSLAQNMLRHKEVRDQMYSANILDNCDVIFEIKNFN